MLGRLVQGESQDAWIYNFIDDFVTVIEEYIANRPQYETEQVEHIAEIQTELTEASKEYVSLQEAYFEEQRCRKLLETELASLKTNYPKQVEEKVLWAVAEAWTNHNPAVPEPIVEIMKHRVEELGYKVISNNRN
jgi:hypothetical protein